MRKYVKVFSNSKISLHSSVQHVPCRRILLNKIVVILWFKIFPAFYGTGCGSVHKSRHTQTQLNLENIFTPYLIRTHFNTTRPSQSSFFFQMVTFFHLFQLIFYAFPISCVHGARQVNFTLLGLIILVAFIAYYKSRRLSL
jgi:hypothetical protein